MRVKLACPPVWLAEGLSGCTGRAKLAGARAVKYSVAPGDAKRLRFQLSDRKIAKLRRKGSLVLAATARNADAAGGTVSGAAIRVRR